MSKESHSFSIEVACKVGVHTAIIIQHLVHLHKVCLGNGENWKNGRVWINKTIRAMAIVYPYMTQKEIRGCIDRLEKDGYIISDHMAENRFDRTKWYSIEEKGFDLLSIPQNMRQNAIPDAYTAFDKKANGSLPKGNSEVPKRANEKFPKGQMNNKVYYNSYSNCNSPVFDKTGGAIPGDVQPFQSAPDNNNGQLPEPRTGLPNLVYSFDDFWRDYDFKKGSKKTARARWDKLKPADIESIRATLEIYKRETVTSDAGRNGGNFKPLRKHPEFYLSGRLWESAADRAEEINGSEPSEFDEQYEKYTHWVEKNYPDIKRSATYLTRKQFVTMKTTSYVVGVRDIGEDGERNLLIKAHKNLSAGVNGSTVHSDVYSYHCQLIKERLKARSV